MTLGELYMLTSASTCLKLVRTPLNVYFTAFKSSFLSLYAHINSDECHAWFHLNAASPAVRNAEQVNITKILIHGRIRTTNSGTFCFPACTSNPSATETVDDSILKLLQYLLTLRHYKNPVPCVKGYRENENKRIAYLQSGDWYHLNTRWITQKKKFIMSYVSLQYIIFILFLFIIVYIVCIIICFFILYLCNNQGK